MHRHSRGRQPARRLTPSHSTAQSAVIALNSPNSFRARRREAHSRPALSCPSGQNHDQCATRHCVSFAELASGVYDCSLLLRATAVAQGKPRGFTTKGQIAQLLLIPPGALKGGSSGRRPHIRLFGHVRLPKPSQCLSWSCIIVPRFGPLAASALSVPDCAHHNRQQLNPTSQDDRFWPIARRVATPRTATFGTRIMHDRVRQVMLTSPGLCS
jgi:hypothetical protein